MEARVKLGKFNVRFFEKKRTNKFAFETFRPSALVGPAKVYIASTLLLYTLTSFSLFKFFG